MNAPAAAAATASGGTSWWPIVLGVLTIVTSVVIALMNSHADDLKRAERLTAVIEKMSEGPEKRLAESTRDALVSRWVLRAVAPRFGDLQGASWLMYGYGMILLVGAFVWLVVDPFADGWLLLAAYLIGLAFLGISMLLSSKRSRLRRDWLAAERRKEDLRTPVYEPLLLEFERDAAHTRRLRPGRGEAPPSAPAGWYPTGRGSQRFWNGSAWTPNVIDPPPPLPARKAVRRSRLQVVDVPEPGPQASA